MTLKAIVSIDGAVVNPRSLWTQFGSRIIDGLETDYSIIIPVRLAPVVVGDRRQKLESWADLIKRDLTTVGGCMLEAYLEKIAAAIGVRSTQYQWVVVSVQSVIQAENVITLTGRIRPMLTGMGIPVTVPLE